ncbi:unnamed protein product [Paramecium primaurelia]|uniref:Transmembrane protein n=1 Tax=Paramecium primaurelia TaxID=5886 RepID=A0A8S1MRZ1_PARPR|nr:unnamed protein product [Paramecium primaurelia]
MMISIFFLYIVLLNLRQRKKNGEVVKEKQYLLINGASLDYKFHKKKDGKFFKLIWQLKYLFSIRLVPLNKAHPLISTIEQFRPIRLKVILLSQLKSFLYQNLGKSQQKKSRKNWFCKQDGCQYHVGQVIEKLKEKYYIRSSIQLR